MEIYVFARFHARSGNEQAVEEALQRVVGPTRDEQGCLGMSAFLSVQDPALYYIHSRWASEEAFETHALLPHTVQFIQEVEALVDQPLDVMRTQLVV